MQAFLDFLVANARPVVVLAGVLLLLVGVVLAFSTSKVAAVTLMIIGAGLVATPVLKEFSAGGEYGVKLVTSVTETSEKLAQATAANTKAIEELKVAFESMRQLIDGNKSASSTDQNNNLIFPSDKFILYDKNTENALKKFEFNIDESKALNDAISKKIDMQKIIINKM